MVTIAHRKAIDVHRASRRRAVPVAAAERSPEPASDPVEHDDLYGALRGLPDRQRQAVAYHHLAGLSHREVAAVLGGTEEAVRRASADGIKKLRRTYQQERAHGMNATENEAASTRDRLFGALAKDEMETMERLRSRLAEAAGNAGLLDVAYRTLDTSSDASSWRRPSRAWSGAVGSACARNPLPVVVPCHRVVRADGSFGG